MACALLCQVRGNPIFNPSPHQMFERHPCSGDLRAKSIIGAHASKRHSAHDTPRDTRHITHTPGEGCCWFQCCWGQVRLKGEGLAPYHQLWYRANENSFAAEPENRRPQKQGKQGRTPGHPIPQKKKHPTEEPSSALMRIGTCPLFFTVRWGACWNLRQQNLEVKALKSSSSPSLASPVGS